MWHTASITDRDLLSCLPRTPGFEGKPLDQTTSTLFYREAVVIPAVPREAK